MGPAALLLMAASIGGGILGSKRKTIDPNWLYQHFGPNVVNQETITLMNGLLNSPYGQNLMASASEQGQQFGRDTASAAAKAGLGAGEGATSGADIFATSAAKGAGAALQRGVSSDFYKMSLPIAQNMVGQRMSAYLSNLGGYQDDSSRIWQAIGNAAGTAGSLIPQPDQKSGTLGSQTTSPTLSDYNNPLSPTYSGPGMSGFGQQNIGNPNLWSPAAQLPDVRPMISRAGRFSAMQGAIQPGGQR